MPIEGALTGKVNLEYSKIEDVSKEMDKADTDLRQQLSNLLTTVNELTKDGMVLQQTSEVSRDTYDNFTTSVKAAVRGIHDFAVMFRSIADNAQDFDANLNSEFNKINADLTAPPPA